MTISTVVNIPKSCYQDIVQWAEKAYPNEGCGLLIGEFKPDGVKQVARLARLSNQLLNNSVNNAPTLPTERQGHGAGKTEFLMDPAEYNRETINAEKEGLDVVGVIHTHPDHPARPSKVDASQPFLAQWSNVIVSVDKGKVVDIKSWFREQDDQDFVDEGVCIK